MLSPPSLFLVLLLLLLLLLHSTRIFQQQCRGWEVNDEGRREADVPTRSRLHGLAEAVHSALSALILPPSAPLA